MSTPIVPTTDLSFVNFMTVHDQRFVDNRAAIGLSTVQTTSFTAAAEEVNKKWVAIADAKAALREAFDNWAIAERVGRATARDCVNTIKNFAANSANPAAVFIAADLPQPKVPAYNIPPGQCTNVKATLNTVNGELKLTWKCSNGTAPITGTVYTIERRVGTSGPWQPVGLSSIKSFVDVTLPASPVVQYNITATRSGLVGTPSGPVSVVFGHSGSGETFIQSVSTGGPSKLAA